MKNLITTEDVYTLLDKSTVCRGTTMFYANGLEYEMMTTILGGTDKHPEYYAFSVKDMQNENQMYRTLIKEEVDNLSKHRNKTILKLRDEAQERHNANSLARFELATR